MADLELIPIETLVYDGTSLMRDDGLFLAIKRGLGEIPVVRGTDTVVPGQTGRTARARVADRMAIELEGYVRGIGTTGDDEASAYYDLVLEMQTLFDPTKDPAVLSATLVNGANLTINARAVPPLLWEETILGRLARLNVQLESVDPYWTVL